MTLAVAPHVREGRSHYIGRGKKKEASDVRFHREKKRVATLSEHARERAIAEGAKDRRGRGEDRRGQASPRLTSTRLSSPSSLTVVNDAVALNRFQ